MRDGRSPPVPNKSWKRKRVPLVGTSDCPSPVIPAKSTDSGLQRIVQDAHRTAQTNG